MRKQTQLAQLLDLHRRQRRQRIRRGSIVVVGAVAEVGEQLEVRGCGGGGAEGLDGGGAEEGREDEGVWGGGGALDEVDCHGGGGGGFGEGEEGLGVGLLAGGDRDGEMGRCWLG